MLDNPGIRIGVIVVLIGAVLSTHPMLAAWTATHQPAGDRRTSGTAPKRAHWLDAPVSIAIATKRSGPGTVTSRQSHG